MPQIQPESTAKPPDYGLTLAFIEGISLAALPDNRLELSRAGRSLATLTGITPGLLAAFEALRRGNLSEAALSNRVLQQDGPPALIRFYYYLLKFNRLGLLEYSLAFQGAALTRFVPGFKLLLLEPGPDLAPLDRVELSRFAYCRKEDGYLVLESPRSATRFLVLDGRFSSLITALAQPLNPAAASSQVPRLAEEVVHILLKLLLKAEMLTLVGEDGRNQEDRNEVLRQWEFHDLLFHASARLSPQARPGGATLRFLGEIPPPAAIFQPARALETFALYKPEPDQLTAKDRPFTDVLEKRRSVRAYGATPVSRRQLGEFLYRTARVLDVMDTTLWDQAGQAQIQVSKRLYPGGGALYELELYLAVNQGLDLKPGLYHYDPLGHRLNLVREQDKLINGLLKDAEQAAALRVPPQVLIIIAAQFQRVAWKYQSMAYSLILKDAGVLLQTMYLVATAMSLAPCALGNGNSRLFAQAAGTDYYVQSSVGEFLLGSLPPGEE